MRHATMYFEDTADGMIDFRIDWHHDNVDLTSEAHKTALMVYNFLDREAAKKLSKPTVDPTLTDAMQNGHGNSAESAENLEAIRRMASSGEPLIHVPHRPGLRVPI